jgi:hypothetical protein
MLQIFTTMNLMRSNLITIVILRWFYQVGLELHINVIADISITGNLTIYTRGKYYSKLLILNWDFL